VDAKGAVVVLQLPTTEEMLQCIRVRQAQGVAAVVEMDGPMAAVPHGRSGQGAMIRRGMARQAVDGAMEADLVTTSTPALLTEYEARAGHRRPEHDPAPDRERVEPPLRAAGDAARSSAR
jgi:hypothetical protein